MLDKSIECLGCLLMIEELCLKHVWAKRGDDVNRETRIEFRFGWQKPTSLNCPSFKSTPLHSIFVDKTRLCAS
jgi:hypothetical protein